jgi:hypothetical protein
VRLKYRPVASTVLINAVILAILLYRLLFLNRHLTFEHGELYAWVAFGVWLVWLYAQGRRLRGRVADLIIAAGNRSELMRVYGKASRRAPGDEEKK